MAGILCNYEDIIQHSKNSTADYLAFKLYVDGVWEHRLTLNTQEEFDTVAERYSAIIISCKAFKLQKEEQDRQTSPSHITQEISPEEIAPSPSRTNESEDAAAAQAFQPAMGGLNLEELD
jgi:hypothetical protein